MIEDLQGLFIERWTAVLGALVAVFVYLLKRWFDESTVIRLRRQELCTEFAKVGLRFFDAHRQSLPEKMAELNDEFRAQSSVIALWCSVKTQMKMAQFLEVSNAYVKKALSGEAIEERLEKNLTDSFSNLHYAMQQDVLGFSPQGLHLRWRNMRLRRKQRKLKTAK